MVRSSQKGTSSSATMNQARQRRADTGVWPCTLDGCTKVFAREADLKRHQRTTKSHLVPGSGVGSPCPLCEATFTRTDAMRRHLKSRHNGKTPETLHLQDTQTMPSASTSRGRRRESPTSDSDSGSDGEQQPTHQRSQSRSQSSAPPYYEQTSHHPPPPPNHMSPSILYQAAMSYEIRHALSPSSPTSPPLSGAHIPHSPTPRPSVPSRSDGYSQPPGHGQFTQYPAHDYSYQSQHQQPPHQQSPYGTMSHQHPQQFASSSHAGPMYGNGIYPPSRNSGSPSPYVQHAWGARQGPSEGTSSAVKVEDEDGTMPGNRRGGRRGVHSPRQPFAQQESPPSGLAALAMHAARIRPMSPLPTAKQTVKTKSELESALGPTRTYPR